MIPTPNSNSNTKEEAVLLQWMTEVCMPCIAAHGTYPAPVGTAGDTHVVVEPDEKAKEDIFQYARSINHPLAFLSKKD